MLSKLLFVVQRQSSIAAATETDDDTVTAVTLNTPTPSIIECLLVSGQL